MKKIIIHFGETLLKCTVCGVILKLISRYLTFEKLVLDIVMLSSIIVLIQSDVIKFFDNQINKKRIGLIALISLIIYILGMYLLNYEVDTLLIIEAVICVISMLIIELLAKRVKRIE